MPLPLTSEAVALLADAGTVKVLATVDREGVPHAVVKQSLRASADGRRVLYLELLETSQTNRNLLRALWYGGSLAISVTDGVGRGIQIKGRPIKTHITGPLFAEAYQRVRELYGDVDLAAVWEIEPEEVTDQGICTRRAAEAARHPAFVHLDRIAQA